MDHLYTCTGERIWCSNNGSFIHWFDENIKTKPLDILLALFTQEPVSKCAARYHLLHGGAQILAKWTLTTLDRITVHTPYQIITKMNLTPTYTRTWQADTKLSYHHLQHASRLANKLLNLLRLKFLADILSNRLTCGSSLPGESSLRHNLEELEGIGSKEQGREEEARVALESTPSRQQHHRAAASSTTRSRQTER